MPEFEDTDAVLEQPPQIHTEERVASILLQTYVVSIRFSARMRLHVDRFGPSSPDLRVFGRLLRRGPKWKSDSSIAAKMHSPTSRARLDDFYHLQFCAGFCGAGGIAHVFLRFGAPLRPEERQMDARREVSTVLESGEDQYGFGRVLLGLLATLLVYDWMVLLQSAYQYGHCERWKDSSGSHLELSRPYATVYQLLRISHTVYVVESPYPRRVQ